MIVKYYDRSSMLKYWKTSRINGKAVLIKIKTKVMKSGRTGKNEDKGMEKILETSRKI